jgi:hypothetical protein
MKPKILPGAAMAVAALSLAIAGASSAEAKRHAPHKSKATAEKHACGGKNGCPAAGKAESKEAAPTPAVPAEAKPPEPK